MLTGECWVLQNLSSTLGNTGWFKPTSDPFNGDLFGIPGAYIGANFENVGDGADQDTISNWLMSPVRSFSNGDTISFYARSGTILGQQFADRLQLRLSTSGASVNVGATATSVGDFTMLLRDINSTYGLGTEDHVLDNVWTQFDVTVTGIPAPNTMGRFAFRYFVEDGGPNGLRSNYIGIDTLSYMPVPEPATLALLAGSLLLVRRRRRPI
ncbi:MAG: PEP-CTERM sorting domain-containing protein [Planctomycetia bacterium]|nr:PEP-CTERM sorting domain-containing protein [Planctomycetia bacterium]MCC7313188.1 choice-of-anchor J domain-containing protein [Planctomycetota bacterium]